MSYCVNCGVELCDSAKECPLCNTPVINPRKPGQGQGISPFPEEKGQVETVKRKRIKKTLNPHIKRFLSCLKNF